MNSRSLTLTLSVAVLFLFFLHLMADFVGSIYALSLLAFSMSSGDLASLYKVAPKEAEAKVMIEIVKNVATGLILLSPVVLVFFRKRFPAVVMVILSFVAIACRIAGLLFAHLEGVGEYLQVLLDRLKLLQGFDCAARSLRSGAKLPAPPLDFRPIGPLQAHSPTHPGQGIDDQSELPLHAAILSGNACSPLSSGMLATWWPTSQDRPAPAGWRAYGPHNCAGRS